VLGINRYYFVMRRYYYHQRSSTHINAVRSVRLSADVLRLALLLLAEFGGAIIAFRRGLRRAARRDGEK
jgi:hypothetical protein